MKKQNIRRMVLTAMFSAIIIVFTVIPNTGYINYGGILEITTLHVIVILGAVALGWRGGLVLGGVWGVTSLLRALTNPQWAPFVNPLVSVVPRMLVGLIAALVFAGVKKLMSRSSADALADTPATPVKKKGFAAVFKAGLAGVVAGIVGTLTNTVLVLLSFNFFAKNMQSYAGFYNVFKGILNTIIGLNFIVEALIAAIIIPLIYVALDNAVFKKYHI